MASNSHATELIEKRIIKAEVVLQETTDEDTHLRHLDLTVDSNHPSEKSECKQLPIFATCKAASVKKGSRLDKLDSKHKAILSHFFKYVRINVIGKFVTKPRFLKLFKIPQKVVRRINIRDMSITLSSNLQQIYGADWPNLMQLVMKEFQHINFSQFMLIMLQPISFLYLEYLQTIEYKIWLINKAKTKSPEYVESLRNLAESVIEYFFENNPNRKKLVDSD